ncbi:MAG: sugar phosphate isomerase/epimerase [Acidothermus cellulolyticus]|nr:sugar phosphate isomerase/epimerase [Acidothermus cellulolyticus]
MVSIRVAAAPVSFGVFELTASGHGLPAAESVLDAVAECGYQGIDLGPAGYLGDLDSLRRRLADRELALAGGWLEAHFADDVLFQRELETIRATLDLMAAAATDGAWRPKPTLAATGDARRRSAIGQAAHRSDLALDEDGWRRLVKNLRVVVELCRERNLEPTFHHHLGTFVEAPEEIERLLEATDVGLCLDTGHLLLGGGDPVKAWHDWTNRINQIHVKDARLAVMRSVMTDGCDMTEAWRRGIFCRLGDGDVDLDAFIDAVSASDYSGWVVVEQDVIPDSSTPFEALVADQRRNREFLRARGW